MKNLINSNDDVKMAKLSIKERIFFGAFFIYLFQEFLDTTMFKYSVPGMVINGLLLMSISIFCIKLFCYDRYTIPELFFIGSWLIVAAVVFLKTGYSQVLSYSIVVISCRGIEFKKIISFFFWTTSTLLLVTIISSQLGIIQDLVYIRDGNSRHALGTLYPTLLSARIYFLTISYIYIKAEKFNLLNLIAIIGVGIFVYKITQGRLDSYLILISGISIYLLNKSIKLERIISLMGIFSPVIGFIITYILSFNYNTMSNFYFMINDLLSGRLSLGRKLFDMYDIKLFGQEIYSRGNGGIEGFNLNSSTTEYFYIDASYLRILFRFGLIFTLILFVYSIYRLWKLYQFKHYKLIIVVSMVCINSIISEFYFTPTYNPFILFLFADFYYEKQHYKEKSFL